MLYWHLIQNTNISPSLFKLKSTWFYLLSLICASNFSLLPIFLLNLRINLVLFFLSHKLLQLAINCFFNLTLPRLNFLIWLLISAVLDIFNKICKNLTQIRNTLSFFMMLLLRGGASTRTLWSREDWSPLFILQSYFFTLRTLSLFLSDIKQAMLHYQLINITNWINFLLHK